MSVLFDETTPLQVLIFKAHLISEVQLYHILSVRLQIEREHLPALQFFPLVKLALGGAKYSETLIKTLAMNDLRNQFGHELDEGKLQAAFAAFVAKVGYYWPEVSNEADPSEFKLARETAVRIAAAECVGGVFCLFIDIASDAGVFPPEEREGPTRVAAEIRDMLKNTRAAQSRHRNRFSPR